MSCTGRCKFIALSKMFFRQSSGFVFDSDKFSVNSVKWVNWLSYYFSEVLLVPLRNIAIRGRLLNGLEVACKKDFYYISYYSIVMGM